MTFPHLRAPVFLGAIGRAATMKIEPVRNATPKSSPPSMADGGIAGDERFVWEVLVPRLLYPARLTVIQTLLERRRPLPLRELADAADITVEHARYHCVAMQAAGALEVTSVAPRADGEGDEPSYYFPKPPQAPRSRPVAD